jgi:hypothetical protein
MVQRQYHAAGPQLHVLGYHRQGGTGNRRVGIEAPKGMKMAFWGPHSRKAVLIGEFGALKQQAVGIGLYQRAITIKIK